MCFFVFLFNHRGGRQLLPQLPLALSLAAKDAADSIIDLEKRLVGVIPPGLDKPHCAQAAQSIPSENGADDQGGTTPVPMVAGRRLHGQRSKEGKGQRMQKT